MQEFAPKPKRGRPKLIEQIWKTIANVGSTNPLGSQRPLSQLYGEPWVTSNAARYRYYDLEIPEIPIRDVTAVPGAAKSLIEMRYYCPELSLAAEACCDDVWSSQDGDDRGFSLAKTLNDGETKVNSDVKYILERLFDTTLSGNVLELVPDLLLHYGDAFASLGINDRKRRIESILFLPTWEVFRVENWQGRLLRFEQRRYLNSNDDGTTGNINLHPLVCVHWRINRDRLYGRSPFLSSIKDWECLKDAVEDLARAAHSVGLNPNLHIMPPSYDMEQTSRYKENYERRLSEKTIVTDFYMMCGGDLRKVANNNPDLKALVDNVTFFRNRIIMRTRLAKWKFGIDSVGAREIAGQPALDHARRINSLRGSITEGIKHICNLELALNGIERDRWRYRIVFPPIIVDPQKLPVTVDESNEMHIEDNTPEALKANDYLLFNGRR